MFAPWLRATAFVIAAAALAACNSGSASPPSLNTGRAVSFALKQLVPLANLPPGGKFTYDIGIVDPATHHYYLADRTNASLDIVDTQSFAVTYVHDGFTGQKPSNDNSGPDGVVFVPGGNVYVGDVNTVKVITPSGTPVTTITTGTAGLRTDEGCYDRDDNLIMFANPADSPPYATWISPATNTVKTKYTFTGSSGLEACIYDPTTKNFLINNDGTAANPHGELDVISAASVVAGTPTVSAAYPEGNCNPAGLDLGPGDNLVVGCDAPAGDPQITLIMNAATGNIVATITQVGGEDEVAYDPFSNRYYTASRDMTANGTSSTGAPGATFTPVLGVISASTNTWIENLPTGAGSHSVAVDPTNGNVYVPVPPTATTGGGIDIFGFQ
ncbi:MAG TPA: hypothetical protein VHT53_08415 [Candidatus Elarobacter sp.]|jgi:hypothetical protein|nr:hypothetical protein [Candidatus Elarobacter sp.]